MTRRARKESSVSMTEIIEPKHGAADDANRRTTAMAPKGNPAAAPVAKPAKEVDPELDGIDLYKQYMSMDEIKSHYGSDVVAQSILILQKRIGDAFFVPRLDELLVRTDFVIKVDKHMNDPEVPF